MDSKTIDDGGRTPGPWEVSGNAYGTVFVHGGETMVSSVGTQHKALVAGGNSHDTLTLANARLIAAAPDLLEALKDARFALYGNGPGNPKIDAAIAKAEAP